ncbi:MAG: metallophosphoesterase [Candidatus Kerfeldbacteria bacterium]|nr:metallophosphoesterase [Candidatus Kerfeldbacteria bacterium]
MRFRVIITLLLCLLLAIVGCIAWFVNRTMNSFEALHNTEYVTESIHDAWSFAVIGDTEDFHDVTRRMIDDMKKQSIDFVVVVGDVSSTTDPEKMREVRDAFTELSIPTYYVIGNNDLFFDEQTNERSSQTFTEVIQQPLNQYIAHNNARMFLLDNSYRKYGFRDETLAWFSEHLKNDSALPYTFLFFHRPLHLPLEEIFGDDETAYSRIQNQKFLDILSQQSISYIFNGHIHLYVPYTLQGIPVVVTGGGGAYPQAMLGGPSAAYFHYLIVHVPHNGIDAPSVSVQHFD